MNSVCPGLLPELAQFVGLDNANAILFFQRQTPQRPSQLTGLDAAVFSGNQFRQRAGNLFDQAWFLSVTEQQEGRAMVSCGQSWALSAYSISPLTRL